MYFQNFLYIGTFVMLYNYFDYKFKFLIIENAKFQLEICNIKERLSDLEAFRLKAYEKNLSMMETRKWEEDLDIDYDDDEDDELD